MVDESKASFAIIRHNFQTPDPSEDRVVEVVKGRPRAERAVDFWNGKLTAEEKQARISHILEPTTTRPGADPKVETGLMRLGMETWKFRRSSRKKPRGSPAR